MSDNYSEQARAEQYLTEIAATVQLLRGQLSHCVGKGPKIANVPIYFDALRDTHSRILRTLEWAYKAAGYQSTNKETQ